MSVMNKYRYCTRFVNHLWAAALGLSMHTGFGQSNWKWANPLPQGNRLYAVSFADANTATAVGELGTILRTTDGGATWTSQWSNPEDGFFGVSFTDANTGTVVGESVGGGRILRTTDGGSTWTSQWSDPEYGFVGVSFTDANTGTVVPRSSRA